jgi:N-acetyl-anhydromuramyl-L-alanine amidase AmpD
MVEIQDLTGFKSIGKNKKKKQIVLCHTSRDVKDYLVSLQTRYNGKNPYLPNYVVDRQGNIINIIPPDTYSKFLETESFNKNVIIICLENLGWLRKNPLSGAYVNWIGNIYNEGIYERKWRGHFFWQPYNEKQLSSVGALIEELCNDFNIPKTLIGHNVKVDGVEKFEGIVTKSNYDSSYTDLSPAFDFEEMKKILEI